MSGEKSNMSSSPSFRSGSPSEGLRAAIPTATRHGSINTTTDTPKTEFPMDWEAQSNPSSPLGRPSQVSFDSSFDSTQQPPVFLGVPASPARKAYEKATRKVEDLEAIRHMSGSGPSVAVILIGGPTKGTRFRPLSLEIPKPLFPLAGRPVVFHSIEACSRVEGLQEIFLLGFYEESLFAGFMNQTTNELGLKITYLQERAQLGTAGGLYFFRKRIMESSPNRIFLLHSDICCTFPLGRMLDFHLQHGGTCSVLTKQVNAKEALNFGCIVMDPGTHEMVHYAEKPETYVNNLINCGVYILDKTMMDVISEAASKLDIAPSEDLQTHDFLLEEEEMKKKLRLEQDILMPLAGKKRVFLYQTKEAWMQIKAAGHALRCSEIYLQQYRLMRPERLEIPLGMAKNPPQIVGAVMVHPSCSIHPSAKLGPNVVVSPGVQIGPGVRVANSIILESATLKDHCCVLNSIIGWNSTIGQWARVEGTPDNPTNRMSLGYTILGNACHVAPELILRNTIVLPHKTLTQSYHSEILL